MVILCPIILHLLPPHHSCVGAYLDLAFQRYPRFGLDQLRALPPPGFQSTQWPEPRPIDAFSRQLNYQPGPGETSFRVLLVRFLEGFLICSAAPLPSLSNSHPAFHSACARGSHHHHHHPEFLTLILYGAVSTLLQGLNLAGQLVQVTATNSLAINTTDIAVIPCDDSAANYPGELGVDQTVQSAITAANRPAAIILYSTSATHCNLTTDDTTEAYRFILTFRDLHGIDISQLLKNSSDNQVTIQPDMASLTTSASPVDGSSNGTGPSNGPNTGKAAFPLVFPPLDLINGRASVKSANSSF